MGRAVERRRERAAAAKTASSRACSVGPCAVAAALTLLAASGCEVHFVPAPDTPDHVTVTYSAVEDLTRVRWQIAAADLPAFEIADGTGGYRSVDFAGALYPSGPWACGGGTCFQLVVRGRVTVPDDGALLRAITADLGTLRGTAPTLGDAPDPPVKLTVALDDTNQTETVAVDDWLTAPGLARTFALTVWPQPAPSSGASTCSDDARPDDAATVGPGSRALPFTAPLTDAGAYCARVRPLPRDGGARAAFLAPFLTAPQLYRRELDWSPPFETAPVVWRLLTDLQVVDPQRCTQDETVVHDTFASALSVGTSHELPAVDLAPGCQQSAARSFDAAALADETKQWLTQHYTIEYEAPVLVYVDNLAAPLPLSLEQSFAAWQASFTDPHVLPLDIAMGTQAVLASPAFDLKLQFVAIEDPQFKTTISNFVDENLPVMSQLHDDADVIALMEPGELAKAAGGLWKECQASPEIQRLAGQTPIDPSDIATLVDPSQPPGFRVALPAKIRVPRVQFRSDHVIVRYEVCTRWCDHPFTDEAGARHDDWRTERLCERNEAP